MAELRERVAAAEVKATKYEAKLDSYRRLFGAIVREFLTGGWLYRNDAAHSIRPSLISAER